MDTLPKKRELSDESSDDDVPLGLKRQKLVAASAEGGTVPHETSTALSCSANPSAKAEIKPELDADAQCTFPAEKPLPTEIGGGGREKEEDSKQRPADWSDGVKAENTQETAATPAVGATGAASSCKGVAAGSLAAALTAVKSDKKSPSAATPVGVKGEKGSGNPSVSPSPGARRRNRFVKTEENFEPISRWWEKNLSQIENAVVQWQYLEHNGLMFAPAYEPHGVKIKYKGEEVVLPPDAEEVANFWCGVLESEYATKIRFVRNFWRAFLSKLPADHPIKKDPQHSQVELPEDPEAAPGTEGIEKKSGFAACDFSSIKRHLDNLKEAKKNLSREEKEALRAQKDAENAPYAFALVDWLREKVGNSKVEPPGLFRGRGEHPKQGMLKRRIFPEDVILNLAEDAPVPKAVCMPGHCWKDIAHDSTVTWLAFYRDSINDQVKYMYLAAQSGFKGQQDFLKYEKARKLKFYVDKIREDYKKKMKSGDIVERQLGTATYLIDFLALRVGGEKDTDEEADTVGCCSLRVEHTSLNKDTEEVTFDFLGKDSIRYFNTVKIDQQAFRNLEAFCKGKKPDEDVFDRINSASLNNHLKHLMPGLSAKMFRTYNASITLQQELRKLRPTLRHFLNSVKKESEIQPKARGGKAKKQLPEEVTPQAVSITASGECTVGEGRAEDSFFATTAAAEDVEGPVLDVNLSDPNQLVQFYNDANRAVAILCNHQRSVPKQHAASMARLEVQLAIIEEDLKELRAFQAHLKKNKGDGRNFKFESVVKDAKGEPRKLIVKGTMREDACVKRIQQLEKRHQAHLLKMRMKEENKTVALGTSKINYMDPRITVAFCKTYELPIEKIFNKIKMYLPSLKNLNVFAELAA